MHDTYYNQKMYIVNILRIFECANIASDFLHGLYLTSTSQGAQPTQCKLSYTVILILTLTVAPCFHDNLEVDSEEHEHSRSSQGTCLIQK